MTIDLEDRVRESLHAWGSTVPDLTFGAGDVRRRPLHPAGRRPLAIAAAFAVLLAGAVVIRTRRGTESISTGPSSSIAVATTDSVATNTTTEAAALPSERVPLFLPTPPAGYRLRGGTEMWGFAVEPAYNMVFASADPAGGYVVVAMTDSAQQPRTPSTSGSLTTVRGDLAELTGSFPGPFSEDRITWQEAGRFWSVRVVAPRPVDGDPDLRALAERVKVSTSGSTPPFTFDAPAGARKIFDGVDPAHFEGLRTMSFESDDLAKPENARLSFWARSTGLADMAVERDRGVGKLDAATAAVGSGLKWIERAGVELGVAAEAPRDRLHPADASFAEATAFAQSVREVDSATFESVVKGRVQRLNPSEAFAEQWGLRPFGQETTTFAGRSGADEWFVQWAQRGSETCIRSSVPNDQASSSCLPRYDSAIFLAQPNVSHNRVSVGVVRGDVVRVEMIDPLDGRVVGRSDAAAADRAVNARAYYSTITTAGLAVGTAPLVIVAYDRAGRELGRDNLFASENFRPNFNPPAVDEGALPDPFGPHEVITGGDFAGKHWELRALSGVPCAWLVFPTTSDGRFANTCFSGFGQGDPGFPYLELTELRRRFMVLGVDEGVTSVRATFEGGPTATATVVRVTGGDGVTHPGVIVPIGLLTTLVRLDALDRSGATIATMTGRVPGEIGLAWSMGSRGVRTTQSALSV
jgi:hypothetical protein